jgi:hypothetical protein
MLKGMYLATVAPSTLLPAPTPSQCLLTWLSMLCLPCFKLEHSSSSLPTHLNNTCVAVLRCVQAVAGAPQLLTMKVDAVRARHELLTSLAALQPGWTSQLADASKETLAVWLCSRCAVTLHLEF